MGHAVCWRAWMRYDMHTLALENGHTNEIFSELWIHVLVV